MKIAIDQRQTRTRSEDLTGVIKMHSQWHPIETAPIDSDVLLFVPDDFIGVGMGWEMARSNKEIYWTVHGIGRVNPTHWMPLPELPK